MKTFLIIAFVLHFQSGQQIPYDAAAIGPFDTIEQCRDKYVEIEQRTSKLVNETPELEGVEIKWACDTRELKPGATPVHPIPQGQPVSYRFG